MMSRVQPLRQPDSPLLIQQGITVTKSLLYTFVIALANPTGPLLASVMIACCLIIATMGPPTARLRLEQISR
jgi:hypothetical protein